MFEQVLDAWKRYMTILAPALPENDPRLNLGAEVRTRLVQLDLILRYLNDALAVIQIDPKEAAEHNAWMQQMFAALDRGDITQAEFETALSQNFDYERARSQADAWESVTLFTESFYFFAWRLREVLSRSGPLQFPHIGKVRATEILTVRNHLIEHPEGHGQNFLQGLVVTNAGPVLRSTTVVVSTATGMTRPDDGATDQGLLKNAEALRDELQRRLDKALAILTAELSASDQPS